MEETALLTRLKPQKSRKEHVAPYPKGINAQILRAIDPEASPAEIKWQLKEIGRRNSGDKRFNTYNDETAWRIKLLLRLNRDISRSQRISKSKLCACLSMIVGLELEHLNYTSLVSQREHPTNPLWIGEYTSPQRTW